MILKCPACHQALSSGKDHFLCKNGHGVFLTLENFRHATSIHFSQWIYAHWLRWTKPRENHCPACGDLMVSLHNNSNSRFDFEACPSCFGLWMSAQREQELLDLFRKGEDDDVDIALQDPILTLGKIIYEHEKIIMRYEAITKIGKMLSRKYRWGRFFW